MTYQVLARKWRPKVFEDVIGQEHVTRTLQNSVIKKQIAHAYLLTGTRGVGKTTIARIFAKAIKCEALTANGNPCLKCNSCLSVDDGSSLDYIEIDGASNTGVDNIRELIENAQYLPTSGAHKVYVIDEVHMLSVSAFNALLKTLEEPPKHVVFIFATTDPQKLLGTVLSRCQRFDFKNVQLEELKNQIKKIATAEGITFESDFIINELAKQGKGSVRDTLSLLDQVLSLSTTKEISEDNLLMSLGLAKTKSIGLLLNSLVDGNKELCTKCFYEILDENVDLTKFSLQILDELFFTIENLDNSGSVVSTKIEKDLIENLSLSELMWIYETLAKDFEWALKSFEPDKTLLFCLIKICLRNQIFESDSKKIVVKSSTNENKSESVQHQQLQQVAIQQVVKPNIEKVEVKKKTWNSFVENLMQEQASLAVNLERGNILGKLDLSSTELSLVIGFDKQNKIFFDLLNEIETKKKVLMAIAKYFNYEEIKINLNISLVEEDVNFVSKVEIEEINTQRLKDEKRNKILENKFIKEAEEIFNSKIDDVRLNED